MPSYDDREREALETYRACVNQRTRAQRGEVPWSSIGDFFTEDCVFIDPAWGRSIGERSWILAASEKYRSGKYPWR